MTTIDTIANLITSTDPSAEESAALFAVSSHLIEIDRLLRTITQTGGQHTDTLSCLAKLLHETARQLEFNLMLDAPHL